MPRISTSQLGRPRDQNADRLLLTTALTLLDERGYAGFNIDEIARRTSISKATIYRRWRSAGDLLLDALITYGAEQIPVPDTGSLASDLTQYFRRAFRPLNGRVGVALRSLMAEAQVQEAFRTQFRERFIVARRNPLRDILETAKRRGTLRRSLDVEVLMDFIFGAMWYRLLVGHAPLDEAFVRDIVDFAKRTGRQK